MIGIKTFPLKLSSRTGKSEEHVGCCACRPMIPVSFAYGKVKKNHALPSPMTNLLERGHIPGGERDPDPVDLGLLLDSFPFLQK
jgi:hypothetical protein